MNENLRSQPNPRITRIVHTQGEREKTVHTKIQRSIFVTLSRMYIGASETRFCQTMKCENPSTKFKITTRICNWYTWCNV